MLKKIAIEIEESVKNNLDRKIHFRSESKNIESELNHSISMLENKLSTQEYSRLWNEYFAQGPLTDCFNDPQVTEILINQFDQIWIEKKGTLCALDDAFFSVWSFSRFVTSFTESAGVQFNLEHPFCSGSYMGFRFQICSFVSGKDQLLLSFRRKPNHSFDLNKLLELNWASPNQIEFLKNAYKDHKNILVVGTTGVGKTTVIDSILRLTPDNERVLILEDTDEITPPNQVSAKMLTRHDPQGILPEIAISDLIRQSLRLRPDRLIVGEVRSEEAKDLLLALSTGHAGSLCTLHASSAHQALLRLEMLVQMGAPQWSLETIRKLIFMSVHLIATVGRDPLGKRKLVSLHHLSSLETLGIILEELHL